MKGSLEHRPFDSPALEGNPLGDPARRLVTLYLPPGYAEGGRFPTVYFLHGFSSGGASWTSFGGWTPTVPERLDALIAAGTIPPCVGVFVDGWTRVGGSQWINSEAIGRYRDYLVRDVVGLVDRELRTVAKPAARAVVGRSSGGYGALVMGRFHPDVFAHVGSLAGDTYFEYCYLPDFPKAAGAFLASGGHEPWFRDFVERARATKARGDDHAVVNALAMAMAYTPKRGEPMNVELPFDPQTARLRPEVWNRWLVHDPVRFVPKHIDSFRKLATVFIDAGTRDEFHMRWGARMVAQELRDGGVQVVHEEFEDGHMGTNYRFDRALAVLVPRMAGE
ncbi:MAG: esterase family protein [Myxococcaceae bacterium]|nr:esterase family protein [Myxococcaceae bacterium]